MLSSAHNERRLAEWRLRGYAQRLARAEEERRRDSASTVRETVAQTLIGVRFALSRLERLSLPADAKAVVSNVVDVVRAAEAGVELSIRELGPQGLEDHDLLVVLESYLARLREQAGVNIKLVPSGSIDSLPLSIRRLAFTVVSELVRNAAVHASATKIDVRLHADRALSIAVVDDGRGFDPSAVFGRPEGDSGLTRMRDRVASEGGRFTLRSALGAGCVVEVSVPIVGGWSE
jgi:two-component system NarL family sensor kinase